MLYLSVVWFDTRSATLTKLESLRATQQATQSAATLISSDTEMMAVLYGLLDRQDSSPPEYPFSVYRPFAFWKPADLEMPRVRKIMPKSAPVSPKLLAACFNEPIVIFKSIQISGMDVPSSKLPETYFGSVYTVIGESKDSTPDLVQLLCSKSFPQQLTYAAMSCYGEHVTVAYSDVVQSASRTVMATRADVDRAISAAVAHNTNSVAWLCSHDESSQFDPSVNMKGLTADQFFQFFTGLNTSTMDPQTLADLSAEHATCSASEMFTPYGNMSATNTEPAELHPNTGAGYFGPLADLDSRFGVDCGVPGWQPDVVPGAPSSTVNAIPAKEAVTTQVILSCVAIGCEKPAFDASDRVLCYCSAECRSTDLLRNPAASRDNRCVAQGCDSVTWNMMCQNVEAARPPPNPGQ